MGRSRDEGWGPGPGVVAHVKAHSCQGPPSRTRTRRSQSHSGVPSLTTHVPVRHPPCVHGNTSSTSSRPSHCESGGGEGRGGRPKGVSLSPVSWGMGGREVPSVSVRPSRGRVSTVVRRLRSSPCPYSTVSVIRGPVPP